jgi:hypothetical protein
MEAKNDMNEGRRSEKPAIEDRQNDLFTREQIIIEKIRSFDINNHSPVEALVFISRLREEIESQQ